MVPTSGAIPLPFFCAGESTLKDMSVLLDISLREDRVSPLTHSSDERIAARPLTLPLVVPDPLCTSWALATLAPQRALELVSNKKNALNKKIKSHISAFLFGMKLMSKRIFVTFCSFGFALMATICVAPSVFFKTFTYMQDDLNNNQ